MVAIGLALLPCAGWAQSTTEPQHVVLLYPFDRLPSGAAGIDQSIRKEMQAQLPAGVQFFTEFLDLLRSPNAEQEERTALLLREKYRTQHVDLVIAFNDITIEYLLRRRAALFPTAPVVFQVDDFIGFELPPDVGGVVGFNDPARTIDLALRLRPNTRNVFIISGSSPIDQRWLSFTRKHLAGYEQRLRVTPLAGLPLPRLIETVRTLPPNSILYISSFAQDADGNWFRAQDVVRDIAAAANAPVFGRSGAFLGHGAVGGYMDAMDSLGVATARLALRALRGERPIGQSNAQGTFAHRVDDRQMRRWGFRPSQLPHDTEVLFRDLREFSVWSQYRGRILIIIAFMLLQSGLIAALLVSRIQRGRSIRQIHTLNEKLARRARELQALFDVAPVGIAIAHDRAFHRVTANAAFARIFGNGLAGIISGNASKPGSAPTFLRGGREISLNALPMARAVAAAMPVRGEEFDVRYPDGTIVTLFGYAAPVFDSDHGVAGCIGAFVDITDRKRSDVESQEQRRELAHLARVAALGELSGTLAHELNQPLMAILANARAAQRILAGQPPRLSELHEILADIAQDDLRAADVVRRTRALMKNEPVQMQSIALNEVVQEVLQLTRSELIERKVVAKALLARGLPAVLGDRVQLQQVLLNLVLNACDAMVSVRPDERRLVVSTRITDNDEIHLTVTDRGTGIPDGNLSRVFQPFYTSKKHGLGLGLSICRSIIDSHGGRVWAVNNPDRGATFHLVVPAANSARAKPRVAAGHASA